MNDSAARSSRSNVFGGGRKLHGPWCRPIMKAGDMQAMNRTELASLGKSLIASVGHARDGLYWSMEVCGGPKDAISVGQTSIDCMIWGKSEGPCDGTPSSLSPHRFIPVLSGLEETNWI